MKKLIDYIISSLLGHYSEKEAKELAYWIIEETTGITRSEILIGCKDTKNIPDVEIILEKLRNHEPVQYIFGHTQWMGLDLLVTPDTLIPRPETAELIEWILEKCEQKTPIRVVDIGTGTGCIAIYLKKNRPSWQIEGVDISEQALDVAHKNAKQNNTNITLRKLDILHENITGYDVVVSNPPYICEKEKADMAPRVLNYEPHTALFVPDTDPLLFYRRIAAMKSGNFIFFEINEAYGNEVCMMLKELGYTDIELKYDMYGKARMVFGRIEK
jgi:release factor glutamine methyltransferase